MQAFIAITLLLLVAIWLFVSVSSPLISPPLMLAKNYVDSIDVSKYYISEKLDGVRAYWDGEALYSRSGRQIMAPSWFLTALPANALDGELWIGRGRFAEISGLIRRKQTQDKDWREVKYMVFDLPDMVAPFSERYWVLRTLVAQQRKPWLQAVAQETLQDQQALQQRLQQVNAAGGEGLMLRHGRALYQAQRSNDLLKLKSSQDDEAVVLGYIPGEGKLQGMMGALLVKDQQGHTFRLGSGFSYRERQNPPAIGTTVTYTYNGFTANGLPRFARFLRVRWPE